MKWTFTSYRLMENNNIKDITEVAEDIPTLSFL